jgi:hypothetical protein
MKGLASDLNVSDFIAKADAKAAAGDIDLLKNLSTQKIYLFHGYNDAFVAKAATDAAADFYRHYLGDANRGNLFYQTTLGAGHSFVVAGSPAEADSTSAKTTRLLISMNAATIRPESSCSTFMVV